MSETRDPKTWTDRRTLRCRATPEEMYRAWADPDIIAGWFADRARGEAKPGGEIVHIFDSFGMELSHRVLKADPRRRLVLDGTTPAGEPFRQEIRIDRDGSETVLELVHSGFGDPLSDDEAHWDDEYKGVDSGWRLALAILRHYLETYFERPKATLLLARPAEFDWQRLQDLYRSPDGLVQWLADEGAIGDVGSAVDLKLRDAGRLTGKVLADSGREIALEWSEIEGVLELKAFGGGPWPTTLALRASSWADDREVTLARLQPALEASLDRLVAAVSA